MKALAIDAASADGGWAAFLAEPVRDADPGRLAASFRTTGLDAHLERIAADPRFDARLAAILAANANGSEVFSAAPGDGDLRAARLGRADLDALALPCGAVFWAGAFVREIRKPVVTALTERFGDAAFDAALAHRDLGGSRPVPADLDALETLVRADGIACLAAWIRSLPEPVARRVRLKWPDDAAVPATADALILDRGPQILRRVVADLHADAVTGEAP